jgi:transposase
LLDPKDFVRLYRDHLSDFLAWEEKDHADKWLVFPENIGAHLSIDEVAISNGELYTVLTNKEYHGQKRSLIAIVEGTKVETVSTIICKIPQNLREKVRSITRDLDESMMQIASICFPGAKQIDDRFHVQQIVSDAVQEIRIELRKEAIKAHNQKVHEARKAGKHYWAPRYKNGDTAKELLARARYLLYKPSGKWTDTQRKRAEILFKQYPQLEEAYKLTMRFRGIYEHAKNSDDGLRRLQNWYNSVLKRLEIFSHFETPMQTIKLNESTIVNYFDLRRTNASAESFNAKIKNFRALQRGVRDVSFFFYRLAVLYG